MCLAAGLHGWNGGRLVLTIGIGCVWINWRDVGSRWSAKGHTRRKRTRRREETRGGLHVWLCAGRVGEKEQRRGHRRMPSCISRGGVTFSTDYGPYHFLSSYLPLSRSTFPLSYADTSDCPRSSLLIPYHLNRRSSLVLSSGALLISLSVAAPLSSCTIHRLTKRWYCRLWTMSPSPYYFTRSSPLAVYKDVLVAA